MRRYKPMSIRWKPRWPSFWGADPGRGSAEDSCACGSWPANHDLPTGAGPEFVLLSNSVQGALRRLRHLTHPRYGETGRANASIDLPPRECPRSTELRVPAALPFQKQTAAEAREGR